MFADGPVVLIANPAAQIGKGKDAAHQALKLLQEKLGEERVRLVFTGSQGHASQIAEEVSASCATIIGLGGDGLLHEVANGLMRIEPSKRPVFGIIPVGSGNDYAGSLHMSTKLPEAVDQLLRYPCLPTDVGYCNGRYFLETLSFGVDAAIALGTEERRVRTGHTGTRLYLEEGLDKVLHHRVQRKFTMSLDTGARVSYQGKRVLSEGEFISTVEGDMFLLAVQIGPSYGGGFRITPDAQLDDGILDICVAKPPLSAARATYIFLRAKNGGHTGFTCLDFYRARGLRLDFQEPLPVQIDGERLNDTHFDIEVVPRALKVIRVNERNES